MLLKDMFTFLPKSSRPASYGEKEGLYPFFTSSNTIDKFSDTADYDGEYLVIGDGGTGNCKYYNGKFSASDHNYILEPKKDTNCLLVRYFLMKDDYKVLNDGFKGVGIKNVSKTYIQNIEFKKNNKCSDSEIVDSLSKIESIITNKEKELNHLDELVKSRFIEMFEEKDFLLAPIRDFVDLNITSSKKQYGSDGLINYIDISSIDNERNEITKGTEYVLSEAPSRAQQAIKKYDILISTVRPNLRNIAIVKFDDNNLVGSSGFCVLRAYKCNPYYLMTCVLTDKFTHDMTLLTNGATYPAIKDDNVLDYKIINAPIELQNEFADFVKLIDKSKFSVQKEIDLYQELLDKKMDEYFG